MNLELAISIDDYCIDNEVSPKPISELLGNMPELYFRQLIECARHWKPTERLAVGSLIVNQPLEAIGAINVEFILSDNPDRQFTPEGVTWFGIRLKQSSDAHLVMLIEGDLNADVNSPAQRAAKMAAERMAVRGLKIDEQFIYLYEFVRQVASHGFGEFFNLNRIAADTNMDKHALDYIRSTEYELVRQASNTLSRFEGDASIVVHGLPTDEEVRNASHLGVHGDE